MHATRAKGTTALCQPCDTIFPFLFANMRCLCVRYSHHIIASQLILPDHSTICNAHTKKNKKQIEIFHTQEAINRGFAPPICAGTFLIGWEHCGFLISRCCLPALAVGKPVVCLLKGTKFLPLFVFLPPPFPCSLCFLPHIFIPSVHLFFPLHTSLPPLVLSAPPLP
jgi:hypothetical protein